MASITLDAGTGNIAIPSGLAMVIESIDCHDSLAGAITITNSTVNVTYDGYNPTVSVILSESFSYLVAGTYTNLSYRYIGDQFAYRTMDPNIQPASAGFYPGHWGTGIGSKPRNNPASVTESGWYPY